MKRKINPDERGWRCALYCRKSTNDDKTKHEDAKSVEKQEASGRAYAAEGGWEVVDVFADDAISGAEFRDRLGLQRMLDALPERRFDVIVAMDADRIGRDQIHGMLALLRIHEAGVALEYYTTEQRVAFENETDILVNQLHMYSAAMDRSKTSARVRAALNGMVKIGHHACGPAPFGYSRHEVRGTSKDGKKDVHIYTTLKVEEEDADFVRRIFRCFAEGSGTVSIAKALNGEPKKAALSRRYFGNVQTKSPRGGAWTEFTIRHILLNERYVGIIEHGRKQNAYKNGTKVVLNRKAEDVLRVEQPGLRIVPDALWRAVQDRFAATRKVTIREANGQTWGRPGMGTESRYLLTGLSTCGTCGRSFSVRGGAGARRYYGCARHERAGNAGCSNKTLAPVAAADRLVIETTWRMLPPETFDRIVAKALALWEAQRRESAAAPKRLQAELRQAQRERENFLQAIGQGKAPRSVLEEIRKRDARIEQAEATLKAGTAEPPKEFELRRLRQVFKERLGKFDKLLRSDPVVAKQALRKLLVGRILFQPDNKRDYRVQWKIGTSALLQATLNGGYGAMEIHPK